MKNETSIRFVGNFSGTVQGPLLQAAFLRALALDTKVPAGIRDMSGMSGKKYRYLINNLVEATENPRYLEVGSWTGSTACAALYGNAAKALCIDNWSEFNGPKDVFFQNINVVNKSAKIDFSFIEGDFKLINYSSLGKFNIFLFDGPHTEEDQYLGVELTKPALDDIYTFIIDDWNWEQVRAGTFNAIQRCNIDIICAIDIRTTQDGTVPSVAHQDSDWHNGYFIAVCRKQAE